MQAGITEVAELRPPAFERHRLEEYERELAARCIGSSVSSAAGSSFAGASSSQSITPVKRRPEELEPLAIKLEDHAIPPRGGIIGLEDYLPPGQEDHLMPRSPPSDARAIPHSVLLVIALGGPEASRDSLWWYQVSVRTPEWGLTTEFFLPLGRQVLAFMLLDSQGRCRAFISKNVL
ncbi:hypothetical protein D1007_30285 [Hordeum vulgare]|nr:hypothetical protein D1007_30285 [Hordeum vulgare]